MTSACAAFSGAWQCFLCGFQSATCHVTGECAPSATPGTAHLCIRGAAHLALLAAVLLHLAARAVERHVRLLGHGLQHADRPARRQALCCALDEGGQKALPVYDMHADTRMSSSGCHHQPNAYGAPVAVEQVADDGDLLRVRGQVLEARSRRLRLCEPSTAVGSDLHPHRLLHRADKLRHVAGRVVAVPDDQERHLLRLGNLHCLVDDLRRLKVGPARGSRLNLNHVDEDDLGLCLILHREARRWQVRAPAKVDPLGQAVQRLAHVIEWILVGARRSSRMAHHLLAEREAILEPLADALARWPCRECRWVEALADKRSFAEGGTRRRSLWLHAAARGCVERRHVLRRLGLVLHHGALIDVLALLELAHAVHDPEVVTAQRADLSPMLCAVV
eukprot:scaffold15879_cov66-Phaeocystis_antarctica.AAC.3